MRSCIVNCSTKNQIGNHEETMYTCCVRIGQCCQECSNHTLDTWQIIQTTFFLTETKIIELPNIILCTRTNNFFFFPHYLDRVATKLWNRICSKTSFSGPTSSSNIFFIRCTVTNFITYRWFFCVQVPIWQYAFASQVRFKFTNVNLCAYCYLKRSEIRLLFFLTIVYYTIILYKIINYTRLSIFQNLLCLIIITITI